MAITKTSELILEEKKRFINDEIKALHREVESLESIINTNHSKKDDIQAKIKMLSSKVIEIDSDINSPLPT